MELCIQVVKISRNIHTNTWDEGYLVIHLFQCLRKQKLSNKYYAKGPSGYD